MIGIGQMRNTIREYDEIVEKFKKLGMEVRECWGYSDRYYYFIGVKKADEPSNWLLTASDYYEFKKLTDFYFKNAVPKETT